MTTKTWTVQIRLDESGDRTDADAVLDLQSKTEVHGHGIARRNPTDAQVPMIGDELAAARALSDLAHQLLETAAKAIEQSTHDPARVSL